MLYRGRRGGRSSLLKRIGGVEGQDSGFGGGVGGVEVAEEGDCHFYVQVFTRLSVVRETDKYPVSFVVIRRLSINGLILGEEGVWSSRCYLARFLKLKA